MSEKKITSISELRDFALLTIEKLKANEITVQEAGMASKLVDTVIGTIKTECEYSRLVGENPNIPFMQKGNLLEAPKVKKLTVD